MFAPRHANHRPESTRRAVLALEQLERRDLMSAQPVLFTTLSEGARDFANAPTTRVARNLPAMVATSSMMESRVKGRLATAADVDVVKVHLEKGQIFTLDADVRSVGARSAAAKLTLFNRSGQALARSGAQGLGYRITETGTYFVGIAAGFRLGAPANFRADYTLHVRPIGLANDDLAPHWLQRNEGGIYVWQNGDMLNISGPVGHGFSIRGNWVKTTTGRPGALTTTYKTYDNLVHIQTSIGAEIPLYLDTFGMSLTTAPGKFGDLYGELKSSAIWATSEIIQGIVRKFGDDTPFGMDLSADNMPFTLGEIGLRLGKDPLLQATGAPINAAVPYLYINAGAGVNASSEGSFAGITYNLGTLIVDPADPFLYVATDYYGAGVGLSHQGLIPFKPEKAPSQFSGQLFGHVYVAGEFSLLEVTGLPLSVSGEIVLNLNGHGTGHVSAANAAAIGSVSNAMTSMNNDASPTGGGASTGTGAAGDASFWRNFSVGINGNLNFLLPLQQLADTGLSQYPGTDWFLNHPKTSMAAEYLWHWLPEELSVALASASVIYDGPNGGLFFRGGTNDFLEGTELAFLTSGNTSLDVDGAWLEGGKLLLDAKGQYGTLGLPIQGRVMLAHEYDLPPALASLIKGQAIAGTAPVTTTGGYMELGLNVLGSGVTLKGRVKSNGDIELTGTAAANVGIASAAQTVTLSYTQAEGLKFTSVLTGSITITDTIRAKVTVNITLGVNSAGNLVYSGSGSAKIQVKTPHVSLKGVTWSWDDWGSVNIGVSNQAFWFTALGHNVQIALPH
jgi:hypothetical protein